MSLQTVIDENVAFYESVVDKGDTSSYTPSASTANFFQPATGVRLLTNPVVTIRPKSPPYDQVIQYDFPSCSARFFGFGYFSA